MRPRGSDINFFSSADLEIFPSDDIWGRAVFPGNEFNTLYYQGAPGDVALNINCPANSLSSYDPGSAGWFLFIHEIGHALGLKHPFDDGGTGRPTVADLGVGELDIDWATIMACGDDYDYNQRSYDPATPMLLDVLALQHLYDPNMSTNAGSEQYNLTATDYHQALWAAGGHDVVSAAGADRGWYIYLPDDQVSSLNPARIGYTIPLGEIDRSSPRTSTGSSATSRTLSVRTLPTRSMEASSSTTSAAWAAPITSTAGTGQTPLMAVATTTSCSEGLETIGLPVPAAA